MKATQLLGLEDVRTVDLDVPEPGPGEVLVRVEAAGICGTDRHLYKGEFPSAPPLTLGHEFAGHVMALGPGATGVIEGQLVTCDPNIACGQCDRCRAGRVNLCRNLIAIGVRRDGGFADYAVIPAHRALPLPADLDPRHGAFSEPLSCCLRGIDLGAPMAGERVTILGGGVIGLLTLQLARLAGAETMLITRQRSKREVALSVGATQTAGTIAEAQAIWPDGADLVLECAGVAETVAGAPGLTRTGGRIVIQGVLPQGERVEIEPFDLLFREIQMHFAFLNPFTQGRAADLIAAGKIEIERLISREISLSEAPAAIAHSTRPGEVKVLIRPI